MMSGKDEAFSAPLSGLRWLAPDTFEIRWPRPASFEFLPGQKVGLLHGDIFRDYSLISAAGDDELAICVRLVKGGQLSPNLSRLRVGDRLRFTPAFGQFLYQSHTRQAVFAATGTGVAPFVAFSRAGVSGFVLLHGVHSEEDLYYRRELAHCAGNYIPCIAQAVHSSSKATFPGRVTAYLTQRLEPESFDFYFCGRREMIRDAMGIVDQRFPEARVFTETFY